MVCCCSLIFFSDFITLIIPLASLESSAKQIFETEVMYTNASLQNNEVEALDQIDNLR